MQMIEPFLMLRCEAMRPSLEARNATPSILRGCLRQHLRMRGGEGLHV
jgi:hypothetical protein